MIRFLLMRLLDVVLYIYGGKHNDTTSDIPDGDQESTTNQLAELRDSEYSESGRGSERPPRAGDLERERDSAPTSDASEVVVVSKSPFNGRLFGIVKSNELGLHYWTRLDKNCRARDQKITQIVVHTTGGNGGAEQVIRTLKNRDLGIHYIIADGSAFQCADPEHTVTPHAGAVNGYSIGIEVRNPLTAALPSAERGKRADVVHGKKIKTTNVYSEDLLALCFLVNHLCDQYEIPKFVLDSDTDHPSHLAYHGVLAHYNITRKKIDPGRRLMDDLSFFLASIQDWAL